MTPQERLQIVQQRKAKAEEKGSPEFIIARMQKRIDRLTAQIAQQ